MLSPVLCLSCRSCCLKSKAAPVCKRSPEMAYRAQCKLPRNMPLQWLTNLILCREACIQGLAAASFAAFKTQDMLIFVAVGRVVSAARECKHCPQEQRFLKPCHIELSSHWPATGQSPQAFAIATYLQPLWHRQAAMSLRQLAT